MAYDSFWKIVASSKLVLASSRCKVIGGISCHRSTPLEFRQYLIGLYWIILDWKGTSTGPPVIGGKNHDFEDFSFKQTVEYCANCHLWRGPDELRAYTEAEVVEDAVGAQWIATTQQHVCILCHFFKYVTLRSTNIAMENHQYS